LTTLEGDGEMKNRVVIRNLCLLAVVLVVAAPAMGWQDARAASSLQAQESFKDLEAGQGEIARDRAEIVAERLFQAVLARSPTGLEHDRVLAEIRDDQLDALVDTLVASSEYRSRRSSLTDSELLDQYYQGLFDRSVDPAGSYTYGRELARGNDGGVVRALLESEEFERILETDVVGEHPEIRECVEAVKQKVESDRGRATALRLLSAETATESILFESVRGRAEILDERGAVLEFQCKIERLRDRLTDVDYSFVEQEAGGDRFVRCESEELRYRHCPVDTRGGVTLERQLSRAPCEEGASWGYDERGVWVDRGCRGDFRVAAVAEVGAQAFRQTARGWGFVREGGARGTWLREASIQLDPDGRAELRFAGEAEARFAGRWFAGGERKFELALVTGSGEGQVIGAGSVYLRDQLVEQVRLSGTPGGGRGAFEVVFVGGEGVVELESRARGRGSVDFADGRRRQLTEATVDLEQNGRVVLSFDGDSALTLVGQWFPSWTEAVELIIQGGLGSTSAEGAGTLYLRGHELGSVELSVAPSGTGEAFRLSFEAVPD
jgi:hypothetical protein